MSEHGLACIDPRMTVLGLVSRHRATEAVFNVWDRRSGGCICCQALFDTEQQVADRHGLNLELLTAELNVAVNQSDAPPGTENTRFPTYPLTGRNKMAENNTSLKPLRLTETVKGAG